VVNTLITAKAEVDKMTSNGFFPLFAASGNGHNEVVNTLITAGANVNKMGIKGVFLLYI
jgi:ankyrin repeat protein